MPKSSFSYSAEVEYRLAAQWANYTWEGFCDLEGKQQSEIIAVYRIQNMIDAVMHEEARKASQRRS